MVRAGVTVSSSPGWPVLARSWMAFRRDWRLALGSASTCNPSWSRRSPTQVLAGNLEISAFSASFAASTRAASLVKSRTSRTTWSLPGPNWEVTAAGLPLKVASNLGAAPATPLFHPGGNGNAGGLRAEGSEQGGGDQEREKQGVRSEHQKLNFRPSWTTRPPWEPMILPASTLGALAGPIFGIGIIPVRVIEHVDAVALNSRARSPPMGMRLLRLRSMEL